MSSPGGTESVIPSDRTIELAAGTNAESREADGIDKPEVVGTARSTKFHAVSTFSLLLGVLTCILNILLVTRIKAWLLPNRITGSVVFTLIVISVIISVLLIVYGTVSWRIESNRITSRHSFESFAIGNSRQPASQVGWIAIPIILAITSAALTLWAAVRTETSTRSEPPRPCIDIYKDVVEIKKSDPQFRMPPNDRDQIRCDINRSLSAG